MLTMTITKNKSKYQYAIPNINIASILLEHMWIMLGIYVNIELANILTKRTLLVIW